MAENNDFTPGGDPIVPGKNTYLDYGPNLYPVPEQPMYPDRELVGISGYQEPDPFAAITKNFWDKQSKALSLKNYDKLGAIQYFPAESMNFDHYVEHGDFTNNGFIPWRDNNEIYNTSTNFFQELYRSSKIAAPLFLDGVTSGLRSFPDLVDGFFQGDWDAFFSTDDVTANKWQRALKTGASTYGPVSSFLSNFEISAAHMLGTVAEIAAENALLAYATAQSGGGASTATIPRMGMNFGRAFRTIAQGFRNISRITDITADANAMRRVFQNGVKMGGDFLKFVSPLRQTTEFVSGLRAGTETLGSARMFGAFYRDLREVNFALSEAKLEGGFSKLQLQDDLTREFVDKYGYLPQGADAQRIAEIAKESGDFTTKFNLPVIYYSNRIGFGNLFKGTDPLSKLMTEAGNASIFRAIKFNTAKQLFEAVNPNNIKNAFRYGLGNSLNYFRANVMEGIQENLQETIGGASYDYYYKKFYNPSYGGTMLMLGDLSTNLGKNNPFTTGQGFETFLSGFLMGTIPAGGMAAGRKLQDLAYRYTDKEGYAAFKQRRTDLVNKYVTQLNEVYKDPLKFFDPELLNAGRQGELAKYLTQASLNQNKKMFYDMKEQAVFEHLMTVLRSGKIDLFKDKIQNFKQLEGDELTQAIGFGVEDSGKLKQRLSEVQDRLDNLQQRFELSQENFENPVNLTGFKKGTKQYEDAAIKFMAWENAREQFIFLGYTFDRTAERMRDLLSQFKNIKATSKGNYVDLAVLTNPELYDNEIKLLQDEITSLEQGDADSKQLAALKRKRLEAIKKWKNAVESPGGNPMTVKVNTPAITPDGGIYPVDYPTAANPAYENYRNLAKLAFENVVEVEADAVKDSIFREGVDQGFDILMDFLELAKEQGRLTEAINTLADPENFLKLYDGHYGFMKDLYAKRAKVIKDAIEKAFLITDKNDLIHKLLRLKHPKDDPNAPDTFGYVEDPENPGSYFKITNDKIVPVETGSKDYETIQAAVEDHNKATETEAKKQEEAKKKAAEEAAKKEREAAKAAEKPKEKAAESLVAQGEKKDAYTPDQSYYNAEHKVVPKEIEYTIKYGPNNTIVSVTWNYKGATTAPNVEKSVSTEDEFKQLMDLRVAIDYAKTLLAGKMNKSNAKYDKKEDLYTGFINSIFVNPDTFPFDLQITEEDKPAFFENIDVEGLDKTNYTQTATVIKNILNEVVTKLENQYKEKQKAFTSTKQASDPKFIQNIDNTTKVFSTSETENMMREAVLTLSPDKITSGATVKVVKATPAQPKQVFTKNNGAYKVFRQSPPISSELYIDGKLVGYPTYHDVYTFEINGVIKTADQLTKAEFNIFANPSAGTYEDFITNYKNSKAVYDALKQKLGDKETLELSSEEVKSIMTLTPRQGDYIFRDEENLLKDIEVVSGATMLAVIDRKSPDDPIVRGESLTEIADNRKKLASLLGKVDIAEKTKNQGRYIAVFQLANGNPAFVEVSSGYLSTDEMDELFTDIKDEVENTFKKNVDVVDNKRVAKNSDFTRDFDKSLEQRVFIAIPQSVDNQGYGIKVGLTSNADVKISFDNYKDKSATVYVYIPFDKSGKAQLKGIDDLVSRINQSIVAHNAESKTAPLPTITKDYFKNSIAPNANFSQVYNLFTNVDPKIFQNTSIRFTPVSGLVKDVMQQPAKKKVKFPTVAPGTQVIKEEVDASTLDAEDLKGAKKKTTNTADAAPKKAAVLQPNVSPVAQAQGTARTEAVETATPIEATDQPQQPVQSTKLSDIKAKYDGLKAELAAKYTDAEGNLTNLEEYNKELSKIVRDENNEKNKLAAQKKRPTLKVSDGQYYDAQDIEDLNTFKNWMDANMPDIFTVEEMNTVLENLTNNKVVLGRFVSYVKTLSDDSRRVVGVVQTTPSAQFAYHEAFHGIFRLLLTDAQIDKMLSLGRAELVSQLKKKGKTIESRLEEFRKEHPSYLELSDKDLEDRLIEEYLADKFDAFKLNRKGTAPKKGDENFIQRIFNKIREFISRLLNRSYGIQQLFEQIDRGKFKSANVQNNRFTRELQDVPYVQVNKVAYGYDIIEDTQGNEISVKKYLNESDTNRIVSSVVNSFLQRVNGMVEYNKNQVLETILNDYQRLYQFNNYTDQKMTVEKNNRLRLFNDVFTNPEAREDIKKNVNTFLNIMGFDQDLADDEFDALVDDVGDRQVAGQYGDSFGQGGYKSLSKYLRLYIQSTVKEQGDEFGNTILNPETGEKVYMGVNAGVVYNGMVKVMSGVTTSEKFIKRLMTFRGTNPDSGAFIDKFIEDTGLTYNRETGEWSIAQNPRLFNSVFKAFTLFRVDYEDLIIDPKKKVGVFVRANSKDAASNQYNRWQSDFEFYYQDQFSPVKKGELIAALSTLNDPLKSNITVNDDELAEISKNLQNLQRYGGITISPIYYSYSVAKALQARKMDLTPSMQELVEAYDGVVPISPDDFSAIIRTLKDNKNPFLSFDEFVKDQSIDVAETFDSEGENEDELEEENISDEDAEKLAKDIERIQKVGNKSRLMRIAENNAMFDETVLSTSFENAEGESVTSHQYPTFHLAFLQDVIKNKSEIIKRIEQDPHILDSYLGSQIISEGDLSKILDRLKITRIGGLRQISAIVTKDNKLVEDKRRQVNKREGVVYGKFKDREMITALLSMYLLKEEQLAIANPEAKSGFDYITTTRHLIRVIEAKNTGDTINLPVVKSVYGKGENTKLTDEAKDALRKEFMSEYNRISRVSNESNDGNVIADYNDKENPDSKLRGLKFRNFADVLGDRVAYYEDRAKSDNPTLDMEEMNEIDYLIERYLLGDSEAGVRGLVDDFIEAMDMSGVVSVDTNKEGKTTYTNEMLPAEIFGTRFKKPTDRMQRLNLVGDLRANISQIFINDWINTMSFNKLYYGDQSATLKDFIDSVKRASGSNAHGYNMYSDVTAPELGVDHVHTNAAVTIHVDPTYNGQFSGAEQKRADAQTWMTVKGARYNQFALGRLDAYKASVYDKIERGESFTSEEIFGINGTIRNNAQLKVEKIVYADGKMYIKTSAFVLTKQYTSILRPEAKQKLEQYKKEKKTLAIDKLLRDNNNWMARPNMVDLHNKRVALEEYEERNQTVAYSVPESAAKMLRVNVSQSLTNFNVPDENYYTLDNRYMRLQVENSTNKNTINDPTQAMQIIDTEAPDDGTVEFRGKIRTLKELKNVYQSSVAQKVQVSYMDARNRIFNMGAMRNQFTISAEEGKITPKLGEFQKHAIETLKISGASQQLIEFFDVIEDPETGELYPRYDLNHPYTRNKYEELFLAYFRRGVLSQQVPGHSLTLVSDFGVKKIKRATIVKDGVPLAWEVVPDAAYEANPENYSKIKEITESISVGEYFLDELRHNVRTYDQDGNVREDIPAYTEFMMPAHFREFMDLRPGDTIPSELLVAYGVRIPSEDLHSSISLKMVDFMPAYYGSSGVFAKELIEISGADFDVDKLYMQIADFYTKNVLNRETGKWEKKLIAYGYSEENRFAEYVTWNAKNNKAIKDYIREVKENDPKYVGILTMLDDLHHLRKNLYSKIDDLKALRKDAENTDWILSQVATDPSYMFDVDIDENRITEEEYLDIRSDAATFVRDRLLNIDGFIEDINNELNRTSVNTSVINSRLRSLKTEKQRLDTFILFDVMQALGMPTTQAAYDALVKRRGELNIGRLNNLILDSRVSILGSAAVVNSGIAFEPSTEQPLAELEQDDDIRPGLRQEINLDNDNLLGKLIHQRNNKEGQINVGSAVNAMLAYTVLNKAKVEFRDIKLPKRKGQEDAEDEYDWQLEIDGVKFNTYKHKRVAKIEDGKVTNRFTDERIFSYIQALILAMTDNAKNRRAAKFNLNINAVSVVADLVSRGVPLKLAIGLILNPAVKTYYNKMQDKKYKLQIKRSDSKQNIIKEIYATLGYDEDILASLSVSDLTSQAIFDAIKGDRYSQAVAFYHFLKVEEQNFSFSVVAQLMKMTKGPGTELREWDVLMERAKTNLGIGMTDIEFDKSGTPFDARSIFDGGNKMMTAYMKANTQLYEELAKTMFVTRSKIFRQVFTASKGQFSVPFYLREIFDTKMQNNLILFFGLKAYNKALKDRGDDLGLLLNNNLVYNVEEGGRDIVQIINYGRSIMPKNYLLNKYINAIPQAKMQGGKLILNQDNKKGIAHINPSSWGKLDAYQLEKLQNSFIELYSDERTREVALALFAYTAVKDGTMYRADGLMRIFPAFMFDELMGDIMVNVRTLFSQDSLSRYEKGGDKYDAFTEMFGTDFKSIVEDFIKMYTPHVTNKFYIKKVVIGEVEADAVGKPIRYAKKQNGENDSNTIIFDLFANVRQLMPSKEFVQGDLIDVLVTKKGGLSADERGKLVANIKSLDNKGFEIKEYAPRKLGVVLPYMIKTSDKSFYVLQNINTIVSNDEMAEVPLTEMFNDDYQFVAPKAIYKKVDLTGVNAQIPIAGIFGPVPTSKFVSGYWRGIKVEDFGTRAFPKGRATITDDEGAVVNLEYMEDTAQAPMSDPSMYEPAEYSESLMSPDGQAEAYPEAPETPAPAETGAGKTVKTQLEDLGYKVSIVDKVVLITKDGKQQNRKGETPEKFLARVAATPAKETGKKKKKFPKLSAEEQAKMKASRENLGPEDFDADEIIKC